MFVLLYTRINKIIPKIVRKIEFIITISQIVPAIYSLSTKIMKYFGGKIPVKYWKNKGIELIGKINPESHRAGKNPIPRET